MGDPGGTSPATTPSLRDQIEALGPSRDTVLRRRHVVVRRLLHQGVRPRTLQALLPDWDDLISEESARPRRSD